MKKYFIIVFIISFITVSAQLDSVYYYNKKGELSKALNYINKFNPKVSEPNYAVIITWKAELNLSLENLIEAEKYFKIIEDKLDSTNLVFNNLKFYRYEIGFVYYENGKIIEAEKNFSIHVNENNDKLDRMINSIEFLAEINKQNKKFKISDSLFQKVIEMRKKEFGENNMLSKALMLYADLKVKEKNYLLAEDLFRKSIEINSKLKNNDFRPNFLLAIMYKEINKTDKALKEFKKTIDLYRTLIKDEFYWKSIYEFLVLLIEKGDFNECENLIKSIDLKSIGFLKSRIEILDVLSIYYRRMNNFEKVYHYTLEALNLRLDFYDKDNSEIAKSLNNFAMICKDIGEYEKAIFYLYKAVDIHVNNLGEDNKLTAVYFKNLGDCYLEINDFHLSEKYYNISLNIFLQKLDKNQEEFYSLINNMSMMYYESKNYEKAVELNKKYLIHNGLNYFSELNPFYFTTLSNYGIYLNSNLETELASTYFNEALKNFKTQNIYLLDFLSNSEIQLYWKSNNYIELIKSFVQKNYVKFPELIEATLNTELLLKNLTLRNQQRIKKSIEQSNDSVLKEKYEQFVTKKRFLTKLEEQPIDNRPESYETLKVETENLEKDITRLSSTFAEAKKSLLVTWQDVQQKLKPNEVVVDLVSYNYYNKKWTDSIMYGAFVFDKNSKFPKFVSLFEERQLSQLLQRDGQAKDSIQEKIINKQYVDKSISELFFKPLLQDLQNAKTVYVTPSGLAHQINFKALPYLNATFGETFSVHILGSSASVLNLASTHLSKNKNLEFHLFGGIDYNKVSKEEVLPSENEIVSRSSISSFGYLQGTEKEVNEISKSAQNKGFKTILKTERNATEESFKQLDGKTNPFILHIATHGFFFENPKEDLKQFSFENKFSVYKTSDDPMLRSGLAFAGANKNFKSTIIENEADDGILTAKEISNLDLSACELVVLSACETGLGDISGSEGVFGLQRAFKIAGVKNIIMSLWKVPDAQTSELFEIFYKECFNGKSIKEAFQISQSMMKARYSPYFWAGFVLLQ
jgi:CHAT domain-containing protein/tetratricopeptide (TPR) repeat protein